MKKKIYIFHPLFFSLPFAHTANPMPTSISATSLSTSAAMSATTPTQQQQHQQQKVQTFNLCHNSRKLEELNLFFDANNDLCERTASLLAIDEGHHLQKSPEVSDHIQFLITEVSQSDADDENSSTRRRPEDPSNDELNNLVANGEEKNFFQILGEFSLYCSTTNITGNILSSFSIPFDV